MMGKSFAGFDNLALKLSSEADHFASEVHRLQQDETDRMARMKAELEQALADQAAAEEVIAGKNRRLEHDIQQVRGEIKKLKRKEKDVRQKLSKAARIFGAAARALEEKQRMASGAGRAAGTTPRPTQAPPVADATQPPAIPLAVLPELPLESGRPASAAWEQNADDDDSEGDGEPAAQSLLVIDASRKKQSQKADVKTIPSSVPTEEAEEGTNMLSQLRGVATNLGQMLRLERQAEGRYEAEYRRRVEARKQHIALMHAEGKKMEIKLVSLRRKRDKLVASIKRLTEIYRGLAQASKANLLEDANDSDV